MENLGLIPFGLHDPEGISSQFHVENLGLIVFGLYDPEGEEGSCTVWPFRSMTDLRVHGLGLGYE